MSTSVTINSPQELTELGFSLVEPDTLLGTEAFRQAANELAAIIDSVPELQQRPPWAYQARYAAMTSCRRRNLLAYEQGLGKTFIEALKIHLRYGKRWATLAPNTLTIVAPKHTLRMVWMKELKQAGLGAHAEVIQTERQVQHSKAPIWILSYDFLKTETTSTKEAKKLGCGYRRNDTSLPIEAMWQLILRLGRQPNSIIADEVHKLRSGSARTRVLQAYTRKVKNFDGLTGTPADGWVAHLESILGVIYRFRTTQFDFAPNVFTRMFTKERVIDMDPLTGASTGQGKKRKVPGINPDQLAEFYEKTRHLMHRLVATDPEVAPNVKFPTVTYNEERLKADADHNGFYHRTNSFVMNELRNLLAQMEEERREKGAVRNLNAYRNSVLGKLQFLRQAAACPWAMKPPFPQYAEDTVKVARTLELCKQYIAEGRKIIVMCNFKGSAHRVAQRLKEAGVNYTRVYAEDENERPRILKQEQREERLSDFLEDPNIHVLVASLPIVAEGLTLTVASAIIHFDHDWKANLYKQGNSRVIRPGNDWGSVDVHDLIVDWTVERYLFRAMRDKLAATKHMIDKHFLDDTPEDALELDALSIAQAMISDEDKR